MPAPVADVAPQAKRAAQTAQAGIRAVSAGQQPFVVDKHTPTVTPLPSNTATERRTAAKVDTYTTPQAERSPDVVLP